MFLYQFIAYPSLWTMCHILYMFSSNVLHQLSPLSFLFFSLSFLYSFSSSYRTTQFSPILRKSFLVQVSWHSFLSQSWFLKQLSTQNSTCLCDTSQLLGSAFCSYYFTEILLNTILEKVSNWDRQICKMPTLNDPHLLLFMPLCNPLTLSVTIFYPIDYYKGNRTSVP